jgi:hypothetical protein
MSELYLRVIPTDPVWQPTPERADAATTYVAGLFAGPGDHVETVVPLFHDRITLIDGGEYMEDLSCSRCGATIGLDWFWERMGLGEHGPDGRPVFDGLDVTVPCCGATVALPELRFEAPIGFARFEVRAVNWSRPSWDLSAAELAAVQDVLGHPVTQVHAHY